MRVYNRRTRGGCYLTILPCVSGAADCCCLLLHVLTPPTTYAAPSSIFFPHTLYALHIFVTQQINNVEYPRSRQTFVAAPTTSSQVQHHAVSAPTELLEVICDLVVGAETRPVLRIEIEQDAATQHKIPRISAFVPGLSGTCWRLKCESSTAVRCHVDALMAHEHGGYRPQLLSTSTLHYGKSRMDDFVSKALQIHTSAASGARHGKEPVHKVHALTACIPIEKKQRLTAYKTPCKSWEG